jgi:MFS family permease
LENVGLRRRLPAAVARSGFRRLFAVRLAAQFGDGVFQAGLAGSVLFNPQQQATAAQVAAGFAVLLLPYSFIGPFAGVLLDRFDRRTVLTLGAVARAVVVLAVATELATGVSGPAFYASALVVLSFSRLVLSALSASLPHVVTPGELAAANALSTTVGGIATTLGGASAALGRLFTGSHSAGYAVLAGAAALPYLLSGVAVRTLPPDSLGPDDRERAVRETVGEVIRGLRAGVTHLRSRPAAAAALSALAVHRLCYGIWAVCTVLLFRNWFAADGMLRAGLAGLAQFVVATAIGGALAALMTPRRIRHGGTTKWIALMLAAAGIVVLALAVPSQLPLHLLAGGLLGFCSQGAKIAVDTLLQREIADHFRGRVFTLYDMLFNVALVVAAGLTAVALPENGHSPVALAVLGVVYLGTAVIYLLRSGTPTGWAKRPSPAVRPTTAATP